MEKLKWNDIYGWFSNHDAKFMCDLLKKIKNGTIVEIGLFRGRSSAAMMPIALKNNCRYFGIDNFYGGINPDTASAKEQRRNGQKIKIMFEENLEKIGIHRSDYSLYPCNSLDALKYFQDNSLDLVFVDGDHAYESVKKDIQNWWLKIKAGGYLAGHDFNNEEVNRAIQEFAKQNNFNIKTGGNCFAIYKK